MNLKKANPGFRSIMLISNSAERLRTDKSIVRMLRITDVHTARAGLDALGKLIKNPVDVILCDHPLEDMSGIDFLRLLRLHPALGNIPVILGDTTGEKNTVVDALEAGCAGFLLRPYSIETFCKQLKLAYARSRSGLTGPLPEASLPAFGKAIDFMVNPPKQEIQEEGALESEAQEDEVEKLLLKGLDHLRRGRHAKAIGILQKVAQVAPNNGQALEGLAHAWRGAGHQRPFRAFMRKAVIAYAASHQTSRAHKALETLQKLDPNEINPCQSMAMDKLRAGQYQDAAMAYTVAADFESKDDLFRHMARACHMTDAPLETARSLSHELAMTRTFNPLPRSNSPELYDKIMGPDLPRRRNIAPSSRQTASFSDVVTIAKHTFLAFSGLQKNEPMQSLPDPVTLSDQAS